MTFFNNIYVYDKYVYLFIYLFINTFYCVLISYQNSTYYL